MVTRNRLWHLILSAFDISETMQLTLGDYRILIGNRTSPIDWYPQHVAPNDDPPDDRKCPKSCLITFDLGLDSLMLTWQLRSATYTPPEQSFMDHGSAPYHANLGSLQHSPDLPATVHKNPIADLGLAAGRLVYFSQYNYNSGYDFQHRVSY